MWSGSLLTFLAIAASGVLIAAFVQTFNRFVGVRNSCRNARAGIDVQLTKRHDLVPNLVQAVVRYAAHEREVLDAVMRSRSTAMAALGTSRSRAAEGDLERLLVTLDGRMEAYPQLRASDHFMHLQRTLTEIEEQISAARRAFNAHAMDLNNLAEQFPTLLVARLTGFTPLEYYSATSAERSRSSVVLPTS